jgi:hypothetical protein
MMPGTNGHGPRRAILYGRVSTDEQVKRGYSLAQQMETLRAYAAPRGGEVWTQAFSRGWWRATPTCPAHTRRCPASSPRRWMPRWSPKSGTRYAGGTAMRRSATSRAPRRDVRARRPGTCRATSRSGSPCHPLERPPRALGAQGHDALPCGALMDTHSARVKENKKPYHYNACKVRHAYKRGLCEQKRLRAEKFEGTVWSFVFGLLKDPERLRAGMNALIEAEFAGGADPGTEADGRVRDLPPLHLLPDAAAERAKEYNAVLLDEYPQDETGRALHALRDHRGSY